MSRVKTLFDIEIDEVSVVDRPANQHGLIAIAKNDDSDELGTPVDVFDNDGDAVDVDSLEVGDVVYDADGTEYVFVEDESDVDDVVFVDDADGTEYVFVEPEGEFAGVGKASLPGFVSRFAAGAKKPLSVAPEIAGDKTMLSGQKFGQKTKKFGQFVSDNKVPALVGAGAGTAGYVGGRMSKSLGDEVLELLSKAVSDSERDEIIVKALNEVTAVQQENAYLAKALADEQDARIEMAFISKAAEYNLPVSPEVLGPILKSVAEVLTDEELDVLDQLFNAVGDALYEEVGYVGDTDNDSVMRRVDYFADDLMETADVSKAEAMVALLEANPSAYDAYLAENGR